MTAPVGIGDFACTVEAVYKLTPEAERVTDPAASTLQTPITEGTVAGWVFDLSGEVSARIGEWDELNVPHKARVVAAARVVVANGAASYLEAARYPTRSSGDSYAAVLWDRYISGIEALALIVAFLIKDEEGVDPGPGEDDGGPSRVQFSFPPPFFTDSLPAVEYAAGVITREEATTPWPYMPDQGDGTGVTDG